MALNCAPEQAEVVALLTDPTRWAGRAMADEAASRCGTRGGVERIDTHGAHVFLAGDRAIKIKRAVTYPYLDFSTLALRRAALERELEVNRPAAPDIYLRIVAITRESDGLLRLGGDGTPVEFALEMRRFDQSLLLSRQLEAGLLTPDLAKALAEAVAASHVRAPVAARDEGRSDPGTIIAEIGDALERSEQVREAALPYRALAIAALERAGPVLDQRARAGFIRRCHGDLHLDNVVIWQGRPTLFDAIEFDERLATIDTLYDLAFLLMDLDRHRAGATANLVLNRYLWCGQAEPDLAGLAAMPLFLGLRAGIRGMVGVQRAQLSRTDERKRLEQEALAYVNAAVGYLQPAPARLLAVGGFSGTGKSTLAAALAPRIGAAPGAVHLRSDLERKALAGVGETDRLPHNAYTPDMAARVYDVLQSKAASVLRAGHCVVVDAVFSRPEERAAVQAVALASGVAFTGLWLEADAEVMARRVAARRGDASDATPDVVRVQIERGAGQSEWLRVDAGGTPDETLQRAVAAMTETGT